MALRIGSHLGDRDHCAGSLGAEVVALGAAGPLIDRFPPGRQFLIDRERILGRRELAEIVLETFQGGQRERRRPGPVANRRAEDDLADRRVQAVPVQRHAFAGLKVPDRLHVGVAHGVIGGGVHPQDIELHRIEGVDLADAPVRSCAHERITLFLLEQGLAGLRDEQVTVEKLIDQRELDVILDLGHQDVGGEPGIVAQAKRNRKYPCVFIWLPVPPG